MGISIEDIYLKIGRNIILFQEIERNLKIILAGSQLSGPVSKLIDIQKNNKESIKKKTLGNLIQQFTSNYAVPSLDNLDDSDNHQDEEDISEAHFSFEIRSASDLPRFEARKYRLNKILIERNDLVHHVLLKYDISLDQHRKHLANLLDAQFENATIEKQQLDADLDTLQKMRTHVLEIINSHLYKNMLIYPQLMNCFLLAAEKHSRSDGWTNLTHAGRIISQQTPEKYKELKESHKVNTLADLIIKTDVGEIMLETNKHGISNRYFKLKLL